MSCIDKSLHDDACSIGTWHTGATFADMTPGFPIIPKVNSHGICAGVNIEYMAPYFHMDIQMVCHMLNITEDMLDLWMEAHDIEEWPYFKFLNMSIMYNVNKKYNGNNKNIESKLAYAWTSLRLDPNFNTDTFLEKEIDYLIHNFREEMGEYRIFEI